MASEPESGWFEHAGHEYCVASVAIDPPDLRSSLSTSEREVVELVLAGLSNEAIASATKRAPRTVVTLLLRACRKLGVRRRTELAAIVGRRF
jgi:DNA-binding CsgD family transcriptional regulator